MTAADVVLALLIAAVVAGVAAFIALPFVLIRGNRRINEINWRLDMDADRAQSVSNVRTLARWETARRMERKNR